MTSAKKFGVPAHPVIFKEKKMALTIEKGIPIPNRGGGKMSELGKMLRAMEVGDSVLVGRKQDSLSSYLNNVLPKKFCTRKEGGGTRIWRIE